MNITAYPSPNRAGIQRRLGEVRAIVLHDLEGPAASGLATLTTPGGNSAHYVIAEDGRTYELVPEWDVAYHVAAFGSNLRLNRNRPDWLPPYNGRYSAVNAATVGIELAGWAATGFTAAQYTTLGQLVAGICERWHLEPTCLPDAGAAATITTHAWLQTDRSDPGPHFSWPDVLAALVAAATSQNEGDTTDMVSLSTLRDELAQQQGINTTLQQQLDAVRAMLADANSTIGALEHDVIPALQAAAADTGIAQAAAADAVAKLRQIVAIVAEPAP